MSPNISHRPLRCATRLLWALALPALLALGCGDSTDGVEEGVIVNEDGTVTNTLTINGCLLTGNVKCPGVDLLNQDL